MRSTILGNILIISIFSILTGCSVLASSEKEKYQCIPPAVNVAYPVGLNHQFRGKNLPTISLKDTLPLYPWKEISHIPKITLSGYKVELIRKNQNQQEVWVSVTQWHEPSGNLSLEDISNFTNISDPGSVKSYLVYNLQSGEWIAVDVKFNPNDLNMVVLFKDKAENLWGIGKSSSDSKGKFSLVLFKYEEKIRQLIPAEQNDNPDVAYTPQKMIGPDGSFWFTERDNSHITAIYRFGIANRSLEQYDDIVEKIVSPEHKILAPYIKNFQVDRNGYLIIKTDKSNDVIYLNPADGTSRIENINILSYTDYGMSRYFDVVREDERPDSDYVHPLGDSLFLDRKGNLWVDDYGWKEPGIDGIWYKNIKLSADFLNSPKEYSDFGPFIIWDRPHPLWNSHDGMMWFTGSGGGLTRFDPKTGEWCKMSAGYIIDSIEEDDGGNLWILAGNSIYRLEINK